MDFSTWESVVSCVKCGAYGTPACTQKEAEAAWNARFSEPPKQGEDTKETDIDMISVPGHPDPGALQITVNRRAAACASHGPDGVLRMYWFNVTQNTLSRDDAERMFKGKIGGVL